MYDCGKLWEIMKSKAGRMKLDRSRFPNFQKWGRSSACIPGKMLGVISKQKFISTWKGHSDCQKSAWVYWGKTWQTNLVPVRIRKKGQQILCIDDCCLCLWQTGLAQQRKVMSSAVCLTEQQDLSTCIPD